VEWGSGWMLLLIIQCRIGENAIPKASPSPVVESVNNRNGSTFPLANRPKTMTEPGAEKGDGFVITNTSPVWGFPASP
jgi:hypothetical protein